MTQQYGGMAQACLCHWVPETTLAKGEGNVLPANELESLGMEFEGEINDGGMCLCPYESPLPNDHVNVLIKRYGAGGT
mgnify:FL=1